YLVRGRIVGIRRYKSDGVLVSEQPLKDGFYHGTVYRWGFSGTLILSRPYVAGKQHGKVWQWSDDGSLLGTYTMNHGTGIEIHWTQGGADSMLPRLVRPMRDGKLHGYEWWIDENEILSGELHWVDGQWHGIDRCWNAKGRLKRGFPKYYIHGQRVAKRQYTKACISDPTLPKFNPADNTPKRKFPPEVRAAIRRGQERR
ncbi:MAG TPA: hypothetical protein VI547_01030, partial [Anaerolineales bacterium]|nr:hypothetical protein [Anaerolineales bacterium]